jgi:hypothetical protein
MRGASLTHLGTTDFFFLVTTFFAFLDPPMVHAHTTAVGWRRGPASLASTYQWFAEGLNTSVRAPLAANWRLM